MADKKQPKTRYRVLRAEGGAWREDGPGLYIAVPERSWKPVAITTATTTVVSLGPMGGTATGPPSR